MTQKSQLVLYGKRLESDEKNLGEREGENQLEREHS